MKRWKFSKGDLVRLKTSIAKRMFPNLVGVSAEVTSVSLMPDAFRVFFRKRKFRSLKRSDTWSPDYFVKV